jgi:predicted nuclease of restriction endonuclease-like RecB superfamily
VNGAEVQLEDFRPSPPTILNILDEVDLDWIAEAIDVVERAQGRPWRVALDAIEAMPISRRRLAAVRAALARLTGGRGKLTQIARKVRTLVLGVPALDPGSREARIAAAGAELGVDDSEIESLLFADLRGEATITLPHGRPNELEVAAFANIYLIQRALRRAHRVKIWLWDDDGTVLRAATSRGLLVTASACPDGSTLVDIVGPLALFQRTAVYGTTLAQLVPMLSSSVRFVVELDSPVYRTRLVSPVLLPLAPIDRRATYQPLKLARALERLDPELRVIVGPSPLRSNLMILCPDLALEYRGVRWYLELVGFWTASHIERKLAAYAAAGATRVFLCVDAERGCSAEPFELAHQPIGHVVQYTRRVDPRAIYQALTS